MICNKCHINKPEEAFGLRADSEYTRRRKTCKRCVSNQANTRYAKNVRPYRLHKRWNITENDFANLLASQDGKCAICGSEVLFTIGNST